MQDPSFRHGFMSHGKSWIVDDMTVVSSAVVSSGVIAVVCTGQVSSVTHNPVASSKMGNS